MSMKLPVTLIVSGALLVVIGAYLKITGYAIAPYTLMIGLILEISAIILFVLIWKRNRAKRGV